MELTRSKRLARRLLKGLLAVSLALALLWLALPKLLGLAAERWLDVPGLSDLRVDVEQVETGHARLHELSAVYLSPGGARFQFTLNDIDLSYSLTNRHVERVLIARGELAISGAPTSAPSPWPQLDVPRLPLSSARIDSLRLTTQWPNLPPLKAQGSFLVGQTDGVVTFEFLQGDNRFRLESKPQRPDGLIELHAEWQPAAGAAAEATLRIDDQPARQPASLTAQAPLQLISDLSQHFGFVLPLTDLQGTLVVSAQARLGEMTGQVQSIDGTATVAHAEGQLAGTPNPQKVALNGPLKFAWQSLPASAQLALQPGLYWQFTRTGNQALKASGLLERPFNLRLAADGVISDGQLPFKLSSPRWGQWEGAMQHARLQRADAQSAWNGADAKLLFNGQLKTWQQDALQMRDLKSSGEIALNWSPATGLSSVVAAQTTVGRISRSGDSPLSIANSGWQLNVSTTTGKSADFWSDLSLQGEANSPQLTIAPASGPVLTVGNSRIQVSPFRPLDFGSPKQKIGLLLSAKTLQYGSWPAPNLNAQLRIDGTQLHADGDLQLEGEEILRFSGTQTLARACGEATVHIQQTLPTLSRLLQPRPAALLALSLPAGHADGRFDLNWCAPPSSRFDVKGALSLRDATVGWDKAQVEALQATLKLDGLQPLQGSVQLAAGRGALAAGTDFADLNAELSLTPHELAVQAFDLKLLGGAIHSEPVRVPWPLSEQTLPLEIHQLDLGQLLALFEVQGLSGSGQLDGILPLTYRDGSVEIDNGLLNSSGNGTLKYAPAMTLPDNPGLQALRNFHFQQLRTRLSYAANGAYRTQIKLEGNNPDFYSGYPIRFGLNINGELPGVFRSAVFSGDFNRHILEQLQSGKLQ